MPKYPLNARLLIFTDLDGTLLDHDDYSYSPAKPMLKTLADYAIPLIINTSKTFAEVLELRSELRLDHPFVVENGSALFIPENYFASQPEETTVITTGNKRYWRKRWGGDRKEYSSIIMETASELGLTPSVDFQTFSDAGPGGIVNMTGLSLKHAEQANDRSSSEPVAWLGSEDKKVLFIAHLQAQNLGVVEGGRFLHISDVKASKANALKWLNETYRSLALGNSIQSNTRTNRQSTRAAYTTIALGDGANDKEMLETADFGIVVRAAKAKPLALDRETNWITTDHTGPRGWCESLSSLLYRPS